MARNTLKNVMRLIDSAKNQLPPEQDFLNDLKRSIEMTENKNQRKPSKTFKPSSMNCIRNMYFQVVGAEQDEGNTSYVLAGIVHSGSDIHERVQQAVMDMKSNGMECTYMDVEDFVDIRHLDYLTVVSKTGMETKLYHKDLNMSFMCDGIIKYKGKYYILELKTETNYKWQNRKGVDPKHYNQGTAYSIAFGIDNVIFVYITRDTLDMKAFMFTVTDDMKQNLIGKIVECDNYVKAFKVPPMPEEASPKFCSYCMYKGVCRNEQ